MSIKNSKRNTKSGIALKAGLTEPFGPYFDAYLAKPANVRSYLKTALADFEEDGDAEMLLAALRDIAEARGGVSHLADKSGLNRQSLYKMLSSKGNPGLKSFFAIVRSLGLRVRLEPASSR